MNQVKSEMNDTGDQPELGCNVNSTFNFTVGAFAIAAALLISYLAYMYWWK
jgi:hypothetical protein